MKVDLLWNISGMLASMCRVDLITESQARGRFASICVEIDVSQPLRGTLLIDDRRVRVEYESIGLIYFSCERIGHGRESWREGLQGNGYDRAGFGGKYGRFENIDDFGTLKLKSSDAEILDKYSGGVKKDKVGFKYMGTSSNNAGKVGGSKIDILNDLAKDGCEESVTQKGKSMNLKQKRFLSKVTNLKEKIRVNKKSDKSKVSIKSGSIISKAKKQLMYNTSSGNEKYSLIAGILKTLLIKIGLITRR
ncbi:hypothetical protein ACOSP7_003440 [Xanthoceras sorbifolium]